MTQLEAQVGYKGASDKLHISGQAHPSGKWLKQGNAIAALVRISMNLDAFALSPKSPNKAKVKS